MNTSALRQALQELTVAYDASRRRQARLHRELQQESIEGERLLVARDAVQQIVGVDMMVTVDGAETLTVAATDNGAPTEVIDHRPALLAPEAAPAAVAQPEHPFVDEIMSAVGGAKPERTVEGIERLLRENAEHDVHLTVLRDQFRERGWLPAKAKAPDPTVYAAARRAEREFPQVVRTSRRTWRWTNTPDEVPTWQRRVVNTVVPEGDDAPSEPTTSEPSATAFVAEPANAPQGQEEVAPWAP